jgi:hypothetical protein
VANKYSITIKNQIKMTKKNEARLNMFRAVLQFLLNNATVTATIAAFTPIFTAFQNKLSEMEEAVAGESAIITGTTSDKAGLRLALALELKRIGDAIASYAATVNNNALREAVSLSLSTLKRLKEEVFLAQAQNYHDLADSNIAALAPWNILPADVTALQAMIDEYSTAVPAPRNKVAQRTAFNKAQVQAGKDITEILKEQMDPVIYQFAQSNPDFYNQYVQNRAIVNAATIATKIRGVILNGLNDEPLTGVTVSVEGTELSAVTDQKGKFTIKGITPGTYNVKILKVGYTEKIVEDILVKLGKSANINTSLPPAA